MKIGMIVAMDKEYKQLRPLFPENKLILQKSGIATVNAAIQAVEMIRQYKPDCIISSGCAGGNGNDINLAMLQAGLAHHYKRYDNSPAYAAAENEARQNRRGLWSDPNPIPPEQFRHRGKSTAPSNLLRRLVRRSLGEGGTAAPVNDTWPDTGYWLSTNSNKRHNRKCDNYRKTRGYPCSSSDGTPCGKCGG